jgi:class 3 adenylate cyclase/tetratricopeptide (TPR) repeat protein
LHSRRDAMSACPACRAQLPGGARFCPSCGARLRAERSEATERKVVSTLFADLVGFTALGERHDPEDVDAALRAYYGLARGIIERFGGVVEKFIGDAVVGLFGVPSAHEDDAERAVRAALEIVARMHELPAISGEQLRVRCAINTGTAVVRLQARPETGEGVLVGDAVNTAARLLADAPEMEVVVGHMTQRLTSRAISYEALAPLAAKGKAKPVERWTASHAIARYGGEPDRRDDTSMVGREVEVAVLAGLLDRAIASASPQFALVTGEAGIGKSRLIREFFHLVDTRPGMLCSWRQGRCPPYGTGLAYWALREVVNPHAGISPGDAPEETELKLQRAAGSSDLGEWLVARLRLLVGLPGPQSERDENFAAWTRFFEDIARSRPAVVVVEDLHWASETTIEFLRFFVRHASGVPLLVVGTARPEFVAAHPDIFEQGPAVARIDLKALSRAESSRLAQALLSEGEAASLTGLVAERSGGNPLFAEELVRYLTRRSDDGARPGDGEVPHDAPTSILTLIAARLDALPSEQKDLLADASVLGPVFWPDAVAAVGEASLDDVEAGLAQLEEREFVRRHAESSLEGASELGFWHALVRDVAYEELSRPARALRHLRAARWLESRTRDADDFIEVVAHHYATGLGLAQASGGQSLMEENRIAARAALVRAGDRALRLDLAAADHHYALAVETAGEDDAYLPELLLKRGEALMAVDQIDQAAAAQEEAVRLFAAAGDMRRQAYAQSRLAFTLGFSMADVSRSLTGRAVAMLAEDGPSVESIAVLETWATLQLWQGDLSAVVDATRRILSMADQLGLPRSRRAGSMHGYARYLLGERDGLREMLDGIAAAEKYGSAHEVSGLRDAYARCLCVAEDPDSALTLVREWIADAERRRDQAHVTELGMFAARYLLLCGRWDDALSTATGLLEESRHRGTPITEAELCAVLVGAHLGRGTLRAARRAAARFEELQPELGEQRVRFGDIAVAAWATDLRDGSRALRHLEQLLPTADFSSEPTDILWWPLAVRATLTVNEPDLATVLAREALGWPSCPARVRSTLTAVLAEDAADHASAAADYAEAAVAWAAGKSPHEAGLALLGRGRCLLDAGETTEAVAALSQARTLLEGIGSRPALAEVDRVRQTA